MAGPITLVQQVTGSLVASASNMTASMTATKSGNLLVVGLTMTSITDTTTSLGDGTNTLSRIGAGLRLNAGTGTGFVVLYYAEGIAGATTTMTWVHSGSTSACMVVAEYSGIAVTGSLDQSAYGSGAGATATAGPTSTTTGYNELVIAYAGGDFGSNTYTLGAGYGHLKQAGNANADGAMEDKQVTSLATQTATETFSSTDWAAGIATFKAGNTPLVNRSIRPHPFSPGLAR